MKFPFWVYVDHLRSYLVICLDSFFMLSLNQRNQCDCSSLRFLFSGDPLSPT